MATGRRGRLVLRYPCSMEFDILFYDGPPTTTQVFHSSTSGFTSKGDGFIGKPQPAQQPQNPINDNKGQQPSSTDQENTRACGSVNCPGRNVPRVPATVTTNPPPQPQSSSRMANSNQPAYNSSNNFQPINKSFQPPPQSPTTNPPRTSTPINANVSNMLRFDSGVESIVISNDGQHRAEIFGASISPSSLNGHAKQSEGQSIPNMPANLVDLDRRVVNDMPSVIPYPNNMSPVTMNNATNMTIPGDNIRTSLPTSDCTSSGSSSSNSRITYKIRTNYPEDEIVERIEGCLRTLVSLLRVPISNLSTSAAVRHNNNNSGAGNNETTSNNAYSPCCRAPSVCIGNPETRDMI